MSGSVLVIDDEVTLGRNIKAYLSRHGYQVSHAANGREARELLAAQTFDIVLLDMRLPDTDGLELLPEIRERSPAAAIVVMTAHATIPTAVEAMRGGAFDYLTKPVALSELKERLDRLHKGAARTEARPTGSRAGWPRSWAVRHRSSSCGSASRVCWRPRRSRVPVTRGAGHRGDRHRQGAGGPGTASWQRSGSGAIRRAELHHAAGPPRRGRAVRP